MRCGRAHRPPRGHLIVADALLDDLGWPPLDVVVGNPPFLSQLGADDRTRCRRRGPVARAGSATPCGPTPIRPRCSCCARATSRRRAARVVLLQPQSVTGVPRRGRRARRGGGARARVEEIWFPAAPGFDAAVDVCVPVLTVGATGDAVAVERAPGPCARRARRRAVGRRGALGDEATTTAGFRGEYYGMVDHVHEGDDLPDGVPLVTTGMVDLGRVRVGRACRARSAGAPGTRPVVDVARARRTGGRAGCERTGRPKLLVATQTRVVEVAVDEDGRWIPGVPLVVVLAPVERLWPLAAALAAPAVTAWALRPRGGHGADRRAP